MRGSLMLMKTKVKGMKMKSSGKKGNEVKKEEK
jgi:hypothetical protein